MIVRTFSRNLHKRIIADWARCAGGNALCRVRMHIPMMCVLSLAAATVRVAQSGLRLTDQVEEELCRTHERPASTRTDRNGDESTCLKVEALCTL